MGRLELNRETNNKKSRTKIQKVLHKKLNNSPLSSDLNTSDNAFDIKLIDDPNTRMKSDATQKQLEQKISAQRHNNEMRQKILELVDAEEWVQILQLIKNREFTDLNLEIDNGNNLFHLACVKGQTEVIKQIIELLKEKKITLNTNLLNSDGVPGIHLYYKYGGTDTSFFDTDDICYIDSSSRMLAMYLLNRIAMLEILINKTIKRGCIDNTELPEDSYLYYELTKKIVEYSSTDKDMMTRYLNVLKTIWLELKSPSLVFVAIHMNAFDVVKMLMSQGFNFMMYSSGRITPLAKAIDMGRVEIAILIMMYTAQHFGTYAVYKLINASEKDFNFRPIFIAIQNNDWMIIKIMIQHMIPYIDEYQKNKETVFSFVNEIDNGHNTYLHQILISKNIVNITSELLKFFIVHTDLNQENYAGETPAHILFGKGLWLGLKDVLQGREIDLLKVDDMGNNCYSYVAEHDKAEFLEFTKRIKVPIDVKESRNIQKMFNVESIKSMLNTSTTPTQPGHENADIDRVRSKSYGLFNANMIHYMLYLRYLENKYKHMYVPVRNFLEKNRERDMFFLDLTSYDISAKQKLINKQVKIYMNNLYSYLPHNIYWIDEDQNYIDRDLVKILIQHNKTVDVTTQRYVMLKLTIVVTDVLLHANALIYDRLNKEAWRFEPYGITNMVNTSSMDNQLHGLLEEVYGKITYHDPDDYLHGLNFQLVDGEEFVINQNLGDPGGYCLAWSMWFIDVVLAHPDKNVRDIMRNFFDRYSISQILSEEEGCDTKIKSDNYYLDFIRRYAHKLDNEKNKILLDIGVKRYYLYNSVMKEDVMNKIVKLFEINPDLTMGRVDVSEQLQEIQQIETVQDISDN